MPRKLLAIEQILTLLAAAPPRIAALSAGLLPANLYTPAKFNEWSANDVLAHLRSCADVWGSCIALIIAQDRPTIRAINPTMWIKSTDYLNQQFQPSLHSFTTQRSDLLALLEPLAPEGWSRTATVTGAGKVLERTVHSYANALAIHERSHVKQIERIVNALPIE